MKKRFALYGMFAAMAIFVTACGDDSSSSASDPADEEYSSSIDDEESSNSEEEVSSSSTKKDGKSSSSEAKKDDKSSSSEKAKSSSSAKDDKSSSSEKAKSSSSAKDDKSSSSEKPSSSSSEPESSSSEPESSSSSEPESSSSEEPLVSVAPFCEVSVDEKNSEKLYVKYGVGTFSLSIAFDTGDKASVYLKKKGETCSQIMSIDDGDSYYGMAGVSCKVTNCSETDGIATYIEDCEIDKVASGMPTAAELKSNYDGFCNDGFQYIYKEAYTTALNKNMLSAGKYDVMVDMRQDARYVEGEDFYPYVYRTIKIGSQTWMAQNLNYATSSGSVCYQESEGFCNSYGRLYTWETAQTVCPDGWDLPTKADFEKLIAQIKDNEYESVEKESAKFVGQKQLMAEENDPVGFTWGENAGTDDFGFSAVGAGSYFKSVSEGSAEFADFWTKTDNGDNVYVLELSADGGEMMYVPKSRDFNLSLSVRCIKK